MLAPVVARSHIAGSTEDAGDRRRPGLLSSLLTPYIALAERLGSFAAQIASGRPRMVRFAYSGISGNTHLVRNAGLVGLLSRWLSHKATLVNAMQIAAQRGLEVAERHEKRAGHVDSVRLELDTETGVTTVEGAVVLGRPRLIQVDGIYCEAPLAGHLIFMQNQDVPGVIGHVGTVLGRNRINIANFSLGRREGPRPDGPLDALAVVETDGSVPESVLAQLRENPAVKVARAVEF